MHQVAFAFRIRERQNQHYLGKPTPSFSNFTVIQKVKYHVNRSTNLAFNYGKPGDFQACLFRRPCYYEHIGIGIRHSSI